MTIKRYFPAASTLLDAPLFDVAGVMLELLVNAPQHQSMISANIINGWADEYSQHERAQALRTICEAWAYLENNGLIVEERTRGGAPESVFVTREGQKVKSRVGLLNHANRQLLPVALLRGDLSEIVLPLFLGGHYEPAVAAAFKQVEVFVRELIGAPDDLVGKDLMRAAFKPQSGPLTDVEAVTSEQEGLAHLFAGAMQYYKNPFSHRNVGISQAVHAASLILTANELMAVAQTRHFLAQQRTKTDHGV
jgi:uncharacterized protein (TIGR02391 family)